MSQFVILVNGAVYGEQSGYSAYCFSKALLAKGHKIRCVFFYQAGVTHTSNFISPASDEFNLNLAWKNLAKLHNISMISCVSAALRRGFVSENEAKENGNNQFNVNSPFTMGGLGELISGIEESDRLVSF